MNILYRYLSKESIENCITCLNYRFDSVVFFCHSRIKDEEASNISSFLMNKCNTKCEFVTIEDSEINYLRNLIVGSIKESENNYFDITGCDGLLYVAMINVAYMKSIPIHIYDVYNNVVINIEDNIKGNIFDVEERIIKININDYIEMTGGVVKDDRNLLDDNYEKLASIKNKYNDLWIGFSCAMQGASRFTDIPLHYYCKSRVDLLNKVNNRISDEEFLSILDELSKASLIKKYRHDQKGFSFDFINDNVRVNILKSGNMLEHEVFLEESKTADDCKESVCLYWDNDDDYHNDVNNEIDVLKLNGYILTFISCKDTVKLDKNALYELETITRRFGGKYSKMELVCQSEPNETFINRAKSIGIRVRQYKTD